MDENVNPIQEENENPIQEENVTTNTATEETTSTGFDSADIEKNKTMGGLAYILFAIPLIACPDSKFGRFHANQSLLLLIVNLVGQLVFRFIPFIGWILQGLLSLFVLILFLKGLIGGLQGKAERFPIFGQYDIIK